MPLSSQAQQQQQQPQYTITPWRHPSELLSVRTNLYTPTTPEDQAHAVATVAAWKLRGNVPHAVESTALLFDAMLFHAQLTGSIPSTSFSSSTLTQPGQSLLGPSSFALRAAYTTALSRFVTGFADLGRHKGGIGQSMFDVARTIALPPHFVELRHEVAHEEMPGLARLVRSAREAVQWLWGVYWGRLEGVTSSSSAVAGGESRGGAEASEEDMGLGLEEVKEKAREVLKNFRSQRLASLKAKKGKKDVKGQARTACEQCVAFCQGGDSTEKWEAIAEILIDEKLVVPSLKQRGPLPDSALQGAYMLWDEILLQLTRSSDTFVEAFLERAVAYIASFTSANEEDNRSDPAKWAIYRWVLHVLFSNDWSEVKGQTEETWEGTVLRECSLYPNDGWSQELAEGVLQNADDGARRMWRQRSEGDVDMDIDTADREPAVEDEEEVSEVGLGAGSALHNHGGWRKDARSWRPLPLGVVESY